MKGPSYTNYKIFIYKKLTMLKLEWNERVRFKGEMKLVILNKTSNVISRSLD